jgi:hypothetical protein
VALPGRAARQRNVPRPRPVDIDKLARHHPFKDIRQVLEVRPVLPKADPRRDFVLLHRVRVVPVVLPDKAVPALPGRADHLRGFHNALAAVARDKTQ